MPSSENGLGSVEFMTERKHPLASFLNKLVKDDNCLEWKAAKNDRGYGQFFVDEKVVYAHRWIYEQVYGPIPDGYDVCHHCDNPSCVRPQHLFAGTRLDNVRDMDSKGRGSYTAHAGSRHGMSKLTEEDVVEIRRQYAMGQYTYQEIAAYYDVGWTTIQKIVTRTTWTHV